MFSEKRKEDSPYALVGLCRKKGMDVKYDKGDYIEITTPVGFWRVQTTKMPIELEHINRVITPGNNSGYHIQPGIFLSFVDVYSYIRRHDERLTKKVR